MPTHARRHAAGRAGHDARPLLDARAGRAGPDARSAAWPCRRPSGSRRWPTTASPRCPGHAAHGLDEPEPKMLTTEGRPYDGTEIRILGADDAPLPAGEVGDVVVNGPSRFLCFLGNDDLTRDVADELGRLPHRGPRLSRRGRPPRLRRAQQGHHPARRRDGRAGRARARAPAPPGGPRGGGRPAARRAPRRARVRRARPQARAARARRWPSCRRSSSTRAWPSTCGPSSSRSSTSSRARRR